MKRLLFSLSVSTLLASCFEQQSLDKAPLQLEDYEIKTTISELLPKSTTSKLGDDMFTVQSCTLKRDTAYNDAYSDKRTPAWIEYRSIEYSSGDVIVKFKNYDFCSINLVTTLDGKVMVVNGLEEHVELPKTKEFIESLNKKYGPATKTQEEFFEPYDIYTWKLNDRVIKYCVVPDKGRGNLKVVIGGPAEPVDKEAHYNTYIYVIGNEYADKVIGNLHTGELLYCH